MNRVTFTKAERVEGLRLATAQAEARAAFLIWLEGRLRAHSAIKDGEQGAWSYDALTGIAERTANV